MSKNYIYVSCLKYLKGLIVLIVPILSSNRTSPLATNSTIRRNKI